MQSFHFFQIYLSTVIALLIPTTKANLAKLEIPYFETIFGSRYLQTNYRMTLRPNGGYRNRESYAREYGERGSLFIEAVF